ncbi:ABC transporter substrate-binding protein [Nitrosopumilus sp.]|uniref:ABC transporter substrate-binding protein n=1 Tax=Nitrosopumilus sp. TaxID=2024843 RepID=UPI003B5CDDF9
MKKWLVITLALSIFLFIGNEVYAEKNTFFDSVKFIQYLDENTALEEIRNGNLDIYYQRISSDRLEEQDSRKGLQIFDSTGGSYSILVNPAESDKFNPFSNKDARFALNYLIDRKLIVNELMGGSGIPITSYYGPSDPEYLTVIEDLEKFNFRYNPTLAEEIISNTMEERGAVKQNDTWYFDSKPIEITIFVRIDDPVRKSIGEILASELQNIGFTVKKDFGDLNKAFVVVYGSDPKEMKWSMYTEGWGRSTFVRYDSVGLGQMYAPWFSYMPGFNEPSYWNYKNDKLDELTQQVYTGDFKSPIERAEIIQEAITEGVNESVRIFLASKTDQYVANKRVEGIVNDFGAGVPSRFTPINAKTDNDELVIGVKQIYQGAWNPVMGLTDTYSRQIWEVVSDPGTFKHPFTGETFPVRANWNVETNGPDGKLEIPQDAIIWDPKSQKWEKVGQDTLATSKVTFDFIFSNWHNGVKMDMNDIIHSLYFTIEWGTQTDENDKTFDTEFTPRAAQSVKTIKGIIPIDENTIEVYVDYWHFDEGEISDWALLWSSTPWEISAAMENAVKDRKLSFSRSGATNNNVNWLSLIIPNDAVIIKEYLEKFRDNSHMPPSIIKENSNSISHYNDRYQKSIEWIENKNHAIISNGPYYLESYTPESRTITVNAFEDDSYPFAAGKWKEFQKTDYPTIKEIKMEKIIQKNKDLVIEVKTNFVDSIMYFLTDSKGTTISSDALNINSEKETIKIESDEIERLSLGANNIKLFAISNSVFKPDFYESSFFVVENIQNIPTGTYENNVSLTKENDSYFQIVVIVIPVILAMIAGLWIHLKKH